jgi:hypothetical protein
MAKGLPASIIKKYGITKKAWSVYRGTKKRGKRMTTALARRAPNRKVAQYRGAYRRVSSGFKIPSIVSMVPLAPHVLSNLGLAGLGYNAVADAMQGNFPEAIKKVMVNELLMFTGYDAIQNGWNFKAPMLCYGSLLAKKMASKYFRGTRIGPLRLA